jgi:hypothetical protein
MYGTDARADVRYWRSPAWVSDRHSFRASDGQPLGRPSYRVGDHLVIYVSRAARRACPAIVRVTNPPVFDLDRVRREGSSGDDERWGWLTEVAPVETTSLLRAPTLAEIERQFQSAGSNSTGDSQDLAVSFCFALPERGNCAADDSPQQSLSAPVEN